MRFKPSKNADEAGAAGSIFKSQDSTLATGKPKNASGVDLDNESLGLNESESNEGTNSSPGSENGTSTSQSEVGTLAKKDEDDHGIGKQETKAVFRIKMVVMAVLLLCTTIVATSVYLHLSHTEETKFLHSFADDGKKIVDAIGVSLDKTLGVLDSLAILFVSYSRSSNQKWPFVTMPDFAVRMAKLLPLTDAISVNMLPIVIPHDRKKWEAYTTESDDWINEGMRLQENWDFYHGPTVYNGTRYDIVHSDYSNLPYTLK
jgi:hypothetical protein